MTTNPRAHLQHAYRLGHTAAYNDEPMTSQPYPDKRRATDNGVTYSTTLGGGAGGHIGAGVRWFRGDYYEFMA